MMVLGLDVEGTRSRGTSERRWINSVRENMRENGVMVDEFLVIDQSRSSWFKPSKPHTSGKRQGKEDK